jgi:hypothetical protein
MHRAAVSSWLEIKPIRGLYECPTERVQRDVGARPEFPQKVSHALVGDARSYLIEDSCRPHAELLGAEVVQRHGDHRISRIFASSGVRNCCGEESATEQERISVS